MFDLDNLSRQLTSAVKTINTMVETHEQERRSNESNQKELNKLEIKYN
jgi:hypothetical protein